MAIQYQEAEKRSDSKTIVDMSVNDTHVAAMLLASEEQGQERGLILVWSLGSSVAPWRLECSGGGIPRSIYSVIWIAPYRFDLHPHTHTPFKVVKVLMRSIFVYSKVYWSRNFWLKTQQLQKFMFTKLSTTFAPPSRHHTLVLHSHDQRGSLLTAAEGTRTISQV